jgi:ferric-dicitrate binding protein FerR (iron transport regulator)
LIEETDILKFIEGRLSEAEQREVQFWIDSSEANRDEYEFYKMVLSESENLKGIELVDEASAWDEFKKMTDFPEINTGLRRRLPYIMSIAASIVVIAGVLIFMLWPKPIYKELITFSNQDTIKLVDGSKIFVNDSSKIKYYTRLTKKQKERYIEVTGSATFDIAPNKDMPFVVKANGAGVSVLGTIFKVNVSGNRIECENVEGVVKLYEWVKPDNNLILNKGEKAVFENGVISLILPELPPPPAPAPKGKFRSVGYILEYFFDHYVALVNTAPYSDIDWNDKVFVNLNQPLKEIVEQLDTTANIRFRQNCPGCYEFTKFKSSSD